MTAKMWSTYYEMTVTQLIKDSLVKLCVEHVPCSGTLEIDGIVCIACGDDSKQLVVKIHQALDVASQKESRHCDIIEGRVNPKLECHDQIGDDDSTCTDSITFNNDQTVDTVPSGQSYNDLVSAAPTTPICKWPSSPSPCHSLVEPKPDIDTVTDDDFPSSHVNDREFACKRCGEGFDNILHMQAHTAKVHSRYMCKHCLNTFSLRCNLRRHERLHAGLKPYSCDVCCKSFARSTDLKIHLARHTIVRSSVASFTCRRCPKKAFSGLSGLRWHMYKTHKQQDAIHQCSVCGEVFFDHFSYQTHRRLHTDLLVVKPVGDRELLDDRGATGDSSSVSSCKSADPTVTDTSASPAMVSILKMSVISGPLHRSKQNVSGCGSYIDKLPEKANDLERPHPEHVSKPLSRSHPSCNNGVAVGDDTTNVNDTGRCILTRLLMTAADSSRSKRRKGRPVKHVMSSDIVSSDVSDSDASDISSGNTFQLKPLTNGTEAVKTPCHNMTLPFDSQVTVATSARLQPVSVVTSARQQPASVVTPPMLQRESVVTPPILQPVSVVTPARLPPESVVTPPILQPVSVITPPILQPVSVVTPARLQPESVVTPPILQPVSVVTPARLQPESVVTPARLQPVSVVTPARLPPESVVTPPILQPESVVTPPRLQPVSVVTPPRLQPVSVVTPPILQPELVVTSPRLQPVDPDSQAETTVSVLDAESYHLDTSAADMSASERKGYICSRFNCGKVFVGFSKYELHYIEKHGRYPCHFCENSFTGKNNRIRHEKTHVGGKSYRCKDCMRMFSRPDSLREHQFTHTASYREQKCRICGATYKKKAQLLSHMKKCFRGMRILDYNTDSVEVRLPKRGKKEDDHSLQLDGFSA